MISKSRISQVKALHLKKYREEEKLFIAEGKKIVDELLQFRPDLINELFATNTYISFKKNELEQNKIKYTIINADELTKISSLSTPQDALAVCNYLPSSPEKADLSATFSLFLDDIRDPGNLGTILRMADWFGMQQIFCSPESTELYNPKTIQSAMGAFLRVKVNYISLKDLVKEYDAIPVYGAVLNGKNIYAETLKNGLIIIGNEARGINPDNLSLISHPITIPSAATNKTESLNAAVAASIICSEFFRQSSR